MKKAVVLGAGITGLYAAYLLCKQNYTVTLLERNNHVGGICASFEKEGIIFDYGPHKIYTTLPGVLDEYRKILGSDLLTVKKRNSLRLLGKYFAFPVKIQQVVFGIPLLTGMNCGLSYGKALLRQPFQQQPVTYEDYFLQGFGKVGYELLFKNYAKKIWGDPTTLSEELARKRIPVPSILALLKNMIKKPDPTVSAEYFYYPRKGFGQLTQLLKEKIEAMGGKIILGAEVVGLTINGTKVEKVTYKNNDKKNRKSTLRADYVISTVHITDLPQFFSADSVVTEAAAQLKHRGLILVYLVVEKERLFKENWIFFPEKEFIFNRISEQKSFSAETMPKNKTVIIAEVTATPGDERWEMDEKLLIDRVVVDLKRAALLHDEIIHNTFTRRARRVYPIYDLTYKKNLSLVLDYLSYFDNFFTLGRQGLFNYNNTDHCIDMALHLVRHLHNKGTKEDWLKVLTYFDTYRIVD